MELSEHQRDRVDAVLARLDKHSAAVLAGAAGTGKTACVAHIVGLAVAARLRVVVCAYTHQAVGVIRSRLGVLADSPMVTTSTVHAAAGLEVDDLLDDKRGGGTRPAAVDADLVVVDEASMIGATDLDKLRRVIKPSAKLLCVLDNYQLSPVDDTGTCGLNDLPAMQIAPPIYLTEKVRQAEGSTTAEAADVIRSIIDDSRRVHLEHLDMLPVARAADAEEVGRWLAAAARDDVDARAIGFTNEICFRVAREAERALHGDDERWHVGSDIVMLTEYRRRRRDGRYDIARNNATGYVVSVAATADTAATPHGEFFVDVLTVDFDGRRIELPVVAGDSGDAFKFFRGIGSKIGSLRTSRVDGAKAELAKLRSTYRVLKNLAWPRLAWATTAHRSQGSECARPLVLWRDLEQIIRIHKTAGVLEHARALYVAVTRATRDGGAVIVTGV